MNRISTSARSIPFAVATAIAASGLALASHAAFAANTTDFESFTTNASVNYQGAGGTRTYASVPAGYNYTVADPYGSLWTVVDEWGFGVTNYDQRVIDDGTGNKVWRLSNAVVGSFSNQPNSPSTDVAGETGASLWNNRGLNHTSPTAPQSRATATTKYFASSFRFKSATGAPQANLTLNLSPVARQSTIRNGYLSIIDNGVDGFDIGFIGTGVGGSFPAPTIVASGLPYTDWHDIGFYVEFVDGLNADGSGNDIVTVVVNGVPVHVGTSWETYYRSSTPATPIPAVDALAFRSSGTARPANAGNGLLIDDVTLGNVVVPNPSAADDNYEVVANSTLTVAAPGVLDNDTDSNGDTLSAIRLTDPDYGTVNLDANGGFSYLPNTGFVGIDSFTYKASDGTHDSAAATVTIEVKPIETTLSGLFAPIKRSTGFNSAQAGQTVPLKFRLTDAAGAGLQVNGLSVQVEATTLSCSTGAPGAGSTETFAGTSGLQYLGDGYYQWNWKTPKAYASTCKGLSVTVGGVSSPYVLNSNVLNASFQFKK